MREAVIVAGARTPVGRAKKGTLANVRPDDLGALVSQGNIKACGEYEGNIDDLIIGCAMPEAEQGMNMARNIGALAACPIRCLQSRLIAIVLQDCSQLHMEQKELCSVMPIQLLRAEQSQ